MADEKVDGLYAHIETEFIRGYRFLSLPVGARMLYLGLWCYALSQRRETIDRPPPDYLARITGLQRHPIATYLSRLHDSQLLFLTDDTITVVGLKKKHNKIMFKPDLKNSPEILRNLENCSSSPLLSSPLQNNPPPLPPKGESGDVPEKPSPEPDEAPEQDDPYFDQLKQIYLTEPKGRTNWKKTREKWNKLKAKTGPEPIILAAKNLCAAYRPPYRMACQRFLSQDNIDQWAGSAPVPEEPSTPLGLTDEMLSMSAKAGREDWAGENKRMADVAAAALETNARGRGRGCPEVADGRGEIQTGASPAGSDGSGGVLAGASGVGEVAGDGGSSS